MSFAVVLVGIIQERKMLRMNPQMNGRKIFLRAVLVLSPVSLCILFSGCSSVVNNPPATAASIDVSRYSGRWYEIARLPMPFQKPDEAAIAEYAIAPNDTLSVHNRAISPNGSEHDIRGYATILNSPDNTKLAVRFNTWFGPLIPIPKEGNYWILYVDEGYQRAMVGTSDRKYLWILGRTIGMSDRNLRDLTGRAGKSGYDIRRLIRDPKPPHQLIP